MRNASEMELFDCWPIFQWLVLPCLGLLLGVSVAHAQTCLAAPDMGAPMRTTLESTAQRYFEMSARGDTAGLRQNAIAALAASFSGVETAVKDNEASFVGARATARPPFLLSADGPEPLPRAEFL